MKKLEDQTQNETVNKVAEGVKFFFALVIGVFFLGLVIGVLWLLL